MEAHLQITRLDVTHQRNYYRLSAGLMFPDYAERYKNLQSRARGLP